MPFSSRLSALVVIVIVSVVHMVFESEESSPSGKRTLLNALFNMLGEPLVIPSESRWRKLSLAAGVLSSMDTAEFRQPARSFPIFMSLASLPSKDSYRILKSAFEGIPFSFLLFFSFGFVSQ